MHCHEPQGLIWFCPSMFYLTLNAVGPIDCHYMTDRLHRFELIIFDCVLLKKQSHVHLGCPGGKVRFLYYKNLKYCLQFELILKCNIFVMRSCIFSIITPVFSVT